MNNWTPIKYMGFWDIPRIFIVRHRGETILFDSPFDETLDDYPDSFKVFLMPSIRDEDLPKDWTTLKTRATHFLGEISVHRVLFDPSKRRSIDTAVVDELITRKAAG